jgi:hypothetical protein
MRLGTLLGVSLLCIVMLAAKPLDDPEIMVFAGVLPTCWCVSPTYGTAAPIPGSEVMP